MTKAGSNTVEAVNSVNLQPALVPPSQEDGTISSPDKVVFAIYNGILSGRIVPGQKLIETDLARIYDVSRGPVREAFKRLHAEGVIVTTHHRGAYVRSLTRDEALDFLEIVEALTDLMVRKAAEAIHGFGGAVPPELAEAYATIENYAEITEGDQVESSWHFYDALMTLSGNSQITSVVPSMRLQLFRTQYSSYLDREAKKQRALEYAKVARKVLAGDSNGAREAMRIHVEKTQKRLMAVPSEVFPQLML